MPRHIKVVSRTENKPLDSMEVGFYNIINENYEFTGCFISDISGIAEVPTSFCTDSNMYGKITAGDLRFANIDASKDLKQSYRRRTYYWPPVEKVHAPDVDGFIIKADVMLVHWRRPQPIYFDSGSDSLDDFYTKFIDQHLNLYLGTLDECPTCKILLEAHTDNKEYPGQDTVLSQRRAENVKAYILSKGISPDQILISAKGKSMPKVPNEKDGQDDPEGMAQNRRVEFRISAPPDNDSSAIEYESH
jgi:outer membrane protein OmpA-like peptidoglycan-associated protein